MSKLTREYKVAYTTDRDTKQKDCYMVLDHLSDASDINKRPIVAKFPISQLHDELAQERRAYDYAAYMNKLQEAAEQAYKHNHLIDVLTRDNEDGSTT